MSLNGSLQDLGIIDLIQFPHQGRKTGRLTVHSAQIGAVLYYRQGNLWHAENAEAVGIEAIVPLVDLTQGHFSFENGDFETPHSIELDLHHAILRVLKIRDERKNAEELAKAAQQSPQINPYAAVDSLFAQGFERYSWLRYACLLGPDAKSLAEAHSAATSADETPNFKPLLGAIIQFLRAYPNGIPTKTIVDQGDGIVMSVALPNRTLLVVVCGPEAIMGQVVSQVGKWASAITDLDLLSA